MPTEQERDYLVRFGRGDMVHRSTCRFAKGHEDSRWVWADAASKEDWASVPWLNYCQACNPKGLDL